MRRTCIRKPTTNSRLRSAALPEQRPRVVKLLPVKLMQLRPLNAGATADVPGSRSLVQACGPALMARKCELAIGTINGPSSRRMQVFGIRAGRHAASSCDAASMEPICLRRRVVARGPVVAVRTVTTRTAPSVLATKSTGILSRQG